MKVTITSTFSFRKLLNKVDEVFDDYNTSLHEQIAKDAKQAIEKGQIRPPLSQVTKASRKKLGFKPTPALDRSGKLKESLEGVKEGIWMMNYGKYHLDGDGVPKRDFLLTPKGRLRGATKKGDKKRLKDLIKRINSTMRVSGTGRTGSLSSFLKG